MRRQVPLIITFVVGSILIVAVFIPHRPFSAYDEHFSMYFDIIAVFAFILGAGNLIKIHGNKIYRRARDWQYSIVTVVSFSIVLIIGLFKLGNPAGIAGAVDVEGSWFRYSYDHFFFPLGATMFSTLAFYVASASYRAFRAKSWQATILLATAFIILLGRTFIGHLATAWLPPSLGFLQVPLLANWIMAVPNLAGQRAIMIGISLGIISMSLRLLLGIERGYIGAENK